MDYLYKIYWKNKNNKDIVNSIHKERFNFETTLRTGLLIKPYKSKEQFNLYFVFNNETLLLMEKIKRNDNLLSELQNKLPGIANNAFLVDIISSELKSTNDLEGVDTNKSELIKTTRSILNKEKVVSEKERLSSMINSYVLLKGDNALKLPVDNNDIRRIYDEITKGEIANENFPDGKIYRKDKIFVQKLGSVSKEIIHEGISGEEAVEIHMKELIRFLNLENISPLIRIAIGHYYFGYIHPFYDGNGRVGRFISSLFIKQELHYLTAMSLSRGSFINKSAYYKAFRDTNSEINRGETNNFVDIFLSTLIKGQEDIIENLQEKTSKLDEFCLSIEKEERANTKLKKSLLFMLSQSYLFDSNCGIKRDTLIDFSTANNNYVSRVKAELKELEEEELIVAIKRRPLTYCLSDKFINL